MTGNSKLSTNTLQLYPRNVKQERKRLQVRWSEEIRIVAGVNWITKALRQVTMGKSGGNLIPTMDSKV